jgi:hypothetical protein
MARDYSFSIGKTTDIDAYQGGVRALAENKIA